MEMTGLLLTITDRKTSFWTYPQVAKFGATLISPNIDAPSPNLPETGGGFKSRPRKDGRFGDDGWRSSVNDCWRTERAAVGSRGPGHGASLGSFVAWMADAGRLRGRVKAG